MAAAISVPGRVAWPCRIISRAKGSAMLTAMTRDESRGSSTYGSAFPNGMQRPSGRD